MKKTSGLIKKKVASFVARTGIKVGPYCDECKDGKQLCHYFLNDSTFVQDCPPERRPFFGE